ncbi:MAG TPA: hypothetical protein VN577_22975 [Terriglobales bacterium]|nr:hypothetical protein [Terriglobales bacterium]
MRKEAGIAIRRFRKNARMVTGGGVQPAISVPLILSHPNRVMRTAGSPENDQGWFESTFK